MRAPLSEVLSDQAAKLGQLILDSGRWKNKQLLLKDWVQEAVFPGECNPEYGYMWWLIWKNKQIVGFRADGWQGQQLIILPRQGLVIVRMREASEGNTVEENKKYGFHELTELALKLLDD